MALYSAGSIYPLKHFCTERLKNGGEGQNAESGTQNGRFLLGRALGMNPLIGYIKITLNSFYLMLVCFNKLKKKFKHNCVFMKSSAFCGALEWNLRFTCSN